MVRVFIKYLFVLCGLFVGSLSSVSANTSEMEATILSANSTESFSSQYIHGNAEQSEFHAEKLDSRSILRFFESEEDLSEENESIDDNNVLVSANYFSTAWAAKTCTFCLQNVKNHTSFYKTDSSLTKKRSLYLFFEVFRL